MPTGRRPARPDRPVARPVLAAAAALLASLGGCASGTAQETAPLPTKRPVAPAEESVPVPSRPAESFAEWRAGFRARALAEGISPATFDAAFQGIALDAEIIRLDRAQPEFTRQIWDYLDSAVSPTRISTGRDKAAAFRDPLARIEAAHGAEAEALVAVWGLESAYGGFRGTTSVIEGLATLSYDGRRRAFFEPQLMAALRILEAGTISAAGLKGSWAGAMGHTQLLPENYERFGVDFDRDGRVYVWGEDPVDALASTANYLASFGWQAGQPTVRRIALPAGFDYALADQSIRRPVAEWAAMGVAAVDGGALVPADEAAVLLPAGAQGPAWLVYPNFRVIKRYNNATSYALAISLLAQEIAREGGGVSGLSWPRGDRALSLTEKSRLQEALTARGFDTGGIDGRIGPKTAAAIRAYQASQGLTADGYANEALLRRVTGGG